MIAIPLDQFLALCELWGGAVDPPKVLALVALVRRYAGITAEMAKIICDGEVPPGAIASLTSQMESARVVMIPGPVQAGGSAVKPEETVS